MNTDGGLMLLPEYGGGGRGGRVKMPMAGCGSLCGGGPVEAVEGVAQQWQNPEMLSRQRLRLQ